MDSPQRVTPNPTPMSVVTGVDTDRPPRGYHERLAEGWCVYGACPRRAEGWPEPTHHHCAWHRQRVQARQRKQKASRREEDAAAGKCIRCRKPSSTYRCVGCRILDRCDLLSMSVVTGVDTDRSGAIASATRTGEDGRTRYHGQQKRGQQPKWQLNIQDLRHVAADFEQFGNGLRMLASPEAQQRHKSDRTEAERALAYLGESIARRMDDILERLGHFKERHGRTPKEP